MFYFIFKFFLIFIETITAIYKKSLTLNEAVIWYVYSGNLRMIREIAFNKRGVLLGYCYLCFVCGLLCLVNLLETFINQVIDWC